MTGEDGIVLAGVHPPRLWRLRLPLASEPRTFVSWWWYRRYIHLIQYQQNIKVLQPLHPTLTRTHRHTTPARLRCPELPTAFLCLSACHLHQSVERLWSRVDTHLPDTSTVTSDQPRGKIHSDEQHSAALARRSSPPRQQPSLSISRPLRHSQQHGVEKAQSVRGARP